LLCWRGEPLIHAARTKLEDGRQLIQSEHPVLDHTRSVAARLALHGIVSMQYRLDEEQNWKMLEVNPRPAGGVTHSEDAGFGIVSGWAQLVAHEAGPDDLQQHNDDMMYARTSVATATRVAQ
jgi:hypothetical protein